MEEEHPSQRFERLLKRYTEELAHLELDLPVMETAAAAPEGEAPEVEGAQPPSVPDAPAPAQDPAPAQPVPAAKPETQAPVIPPNAAPEPVREGESPDPIPLPVYHPPPTPRPGPEPAHADETAPAAAGAAPARRRRGALA
ncbi:MAG: hypothetical protein PHF00_10965, partial [Elusimicrobia bacterium]|nr:hypothetical protein [Elusimicrobiota bacterium]